MEKKSIPSTLNPIKPTRKTRDEKLRKIAESTRNSALRRVLEGQGQREAAAHEKITKSTVQSISAEFQDSISANGLEAAAREFGVTDLVGNLIAIGKLLKSNGVGIPEGKLGLRIAEYLDRFDIDIARVLETVAQVTGVAIQRKVQLEKLLKVAMILIQAESQGKVPFEQAPAVHAGLMEEISAAEQKLAEIEGKSATAQELLQQQFEKNDTNEKDLALFNRICDLMTKVGMDPKDLSKVQAFLTNLLKSDSDVEKIVERISTVQDLELRERKLDENIVNLAEEQGKLVSEKEDALSALEAEIGAKRKSIHQLDQGLREKEQLQQAISALKEKGVTEEQVLAIARIEDRTKLDLSSLAREIEKIGTLHETKLRFEREAKERQEGVHTLRQEEESLKRSLAFLDSLYSEKLQRVEDLVNTLDPLLTKFQGRYNSKLKSTIRIMDDTTSELIKRIHGLENNVTNLANSALETGKRITQLEPISDVYTFINIGTGEPEKVLPILDKFLRSLRTWLSSHGRSSIYVDAGINQILKSLN